MSKYYVNRRKQKREEFMQELCSVFLCTIMVVLSVVCFLRYTANKDHYYYVDNGYGGYEQVVDRPCYVTEIEGDLVTVETKDGELFAFYGDDYNVGETIICTFDMMDRIIDAR